MQTYFDVFGASGNLSFSSPGVASPDPNGFLVGLLAGLAIDGAAFAALATLGPVVGGFAASMILTLGTTAAVMAGFYGSSNFNWRSGYYLGVFAALPFFLVSVLGGLSMFEKVLSMVQRFGIQSPWLSPALGVLGFLSSIIIGLVAVPPARIGLAIATGIAIAVSLGALVLWTH